MEPPKELPPQTLKVYPVQCLPDEDGISLADIWLALQRHRKAFLYTFLAAVFAGTVVVLLLPTKYT